MDRIEQRKIRNEFDNFLKYHHLNNKQAFDLLTYFISVYGNKIEDEELDSDARFNKYDEQRKPYMDMLGKLFEHLSQELKEWIIDNPEIWAKLKEIILKHKKRCKTTNRYEPQVTFRFAVEDIDSLLKHGLTNNDMYIGFSIGDESIDLQ